MATKLTPSATSPVVPVAPVAPPVQPASVPTPAAVPPGAPTAPPVETAQPHTAHVVPLNRLQPPAGVVVKTGKQPVKVSSGASARIIPPETKATIPEADAAALGKSVTRVS